MAVIHVLDPHTAELIAAGEVVERPASVAKELLENAVDAGASQITLTIERGGISLLEVADNGSGIESEYIAKAFIRHATSKIRSEKDLESIHTLGFRGEALASIASVARVEVLTRTEEDEFACRYRIEGGREQGMEAGARPVGTTISVRDLFYNTPARMKFLKKDSSEGTFVGETISRIALSHPEIAFTFIRDGKVQFRTTGDGKLKSAAYAVLGKAFSQNLLEVEGGKEPYKVEGLVTSPADCRASRGMQFFYINGRFVKNRTMMAALENAYKGTLMQGRFPGCLLMLEMPADLVDVNVHPAKTEVRFAREADVFDAVYGAVKATVLLPASGERQFRFEETQQAAPQAGQQKEEKPQATEPAKTLPAREAGPLHGGPERVKTDTVGSGAAWPMPSRQEMPRREERMPAGRPSLADPVLSPWAHTLQSASLTLQRESRPVREEELDICPTEKESQAFAAAPAQPVSQPEKPEPVVPTQAAPAPLEPEKGQQMELEPPEEEPLRYVGEVFKTYIVTQRGEELCLIDKHAAHERMIYEQIAASYGHVSSQMLLVPVQVNLSAEEKDAVLQNLQMLEDAGVELEDFGGNTVLLRAVPADVVIEDGESLVVELAAKLAKGSKDALSEKTEWVLHSISCRAAMKAGDKNHSEPLMAIAQAVLSGKIPPFCPHGRPIVLRLTKKELEKQFGRLG